MIDVINQYYFAVNYFFVPLQAMILYRRHRYITMLLLLMLTLTASAQESQTEYNFLRLPVSAHAAALGGDNITLTDDDQSLVFHNPALLTSASNKTIGLNYMTYMAGSQVASAGYNFMLKERGSLAFTGQYVNYGTMKEMDSNNNQTGEFSAKDIAIAGHFAYMMNNHISGGISAKFITSYIGDYSSVAVGVDLGLNYYNQERELSVSLVAKNLGGQLKAYDDEFEKMPFDLQAGVSKRLVGTPLRLSMTLVDLNHTSYKLINHVAAGADLIFSDQIWVGIGYNFRRAHEMTMGNSEDDESAHGAGLSFGGGLNLDRFKINVAYGKYHVSSSSLLINAAYTL